MKQITSTEFQRSYQRLTEPHEVTALGRVIGTYFPVGTLNATDFGLPGKPETATPGSQVAGRTFGSPRPAPKPGKGAKR